MSRVPSSVVRAIPISLALAAVLGAGAAFAATDVGSVHFILGRKSFTNDWNLGPPTIDSTARVGQPALGIELTWGREGWPVMLALDLIHSYDDGIAHVPPFFNSPAFDVRLRARTLEVALGLRRAWDVLGFSPYLGAGGTWIGGRFAAEIIDPNAGQFGAVTSSAHGHEAGFGYWAGGGIYRRIGPRFEIGLAGRYSKVTLPATTLTVDSGTFDFPTTPELDAGGRQINLVVGWAFPSRK